MNNKSKVVFAFILTSIVSILFFQIITEVKNSEKDNESFKGGYNGIIKDAYRINPNILKFGEDGKAILSIEVLLDGVSNGKDGTSLGNMMHNENQDACVGYFIVSKKENGDLLIDDSHICDMIDY
jgi:hypothetical protein